MAEEYEKRWQLTKKVYRINVRITAPLYDAMLRTMESGFYYNVSEFLIDVLRKYFTEKSIEINAKIGSEDDKILKLPKDSAIIQIDAKVDGEDARVKDSAIINARIPVSMRSAVDNVLDSGIYLNISHYMREVVRKDLESRVFQLKYK